MTHARHSARLGAIILGVIGFGSSIASCLALSTTDSEESSSSGDSSSSSGMGSSSSSSSSSGASSSSSSSSGMSNVCGDGFTDLKSEECDDGNAVEGDGCTPNCQTEHPEVCPGTLIHLGSGQTLVIAGNTMGAADKFTKVVGAPPGNCTTGSYYGSDWVYAVLPSASGLLEVTLDAAYGSPYVHALSACPGGTMDQLACSYRTSPGITQVSFPVNAGTVYYVVVDGSSNTSGDFMLTLKLQ